MVWQEADPKKPCRTKSYYMRIFFFFSWSTRFCPRIWGQVLIDKIIFCESKIALFFSICLPYFGSQLAYSSLFLCIHLLLFSFNLLLNLLIYLTNTLFFVLTTLCFTSSVSFNLSLLTNNLIIFRFLFLPLPLPLSLFNYSLFVYSVVHLDISLSLDIFPYSLLQLVASPFNAFCINTFLST